MEGYVDIRGCEQSHSRTSAIPGESSFAGSIVDLEQVCVPLSPRWVVFSMPPAAVQQVLQCLRT